MHSRLAFVLALAFASACAGTNGPPPAPPGDLVTSAGALVARLVHSPYDASRHAETCKPWHQVFGPDGRQLTKDLGGLYEHHRGLFLGWNQVRCGAATCDFWHCHGGETQRVVRVAGQPGPGGEQVLTIDWCARDGTPVLHEERRLSVASLDANTSCIHLDTTLRAAGDDVRLGGDPQHSGCQFRCVQAFAEAGAPKVTYERPESAKGGKDDIWTDCRWIAARLPFADGGLVVLRVEHPDNPPATWSTRAYGRFGAMCTATVTKDAPLRLRFAYVVARDDARFATWGKHPSAPFEQLAAAAFPR